MRGDCMKNVVIIGTGGQAKVVADIVRLNGDHLLGFLTNDTTLCSYIGYPVLGLDTDYRRFPDAHYIVAIGNSEVRARFAAQMPSAKWYVAIHPAAVISDVDTQIGEGTAIMANAVVNPGAKIGKHCIINSGATVEHDNMIGDYAHISVGATLGGAVSVGAHTWIGAGATVKNGITICPECMIGAGAVVVKNIEEPGTYVGVPARKI